MQAACVTLLLWNSSCGHTQGLTNRERAPIKNSLIKLGTMGNHDMLGEPTARIVLPGAVSEFAWSPDGLRIAATMERDKHVVLWSLHTPNQLTVVQRDGIGDPTVAFTPNSQWIVSDPVSHNTETPLAFSVSSAKTGEVERSVAPPALGLSFLPVRSAAPDPSGRFMAIRLGGTAAPGVVALYDPTNWNIVRLLFKPESDELPSTPPGSRRVPPFNFIGRLRLSCDGNTIALAATKHDVLPHYIGPDNNDQVIVIFRTNLQEKANIINVAKYRSGTKITDIALSPDGKNVATAETKIDNVTNSQIRVWDLATGTAIRQYATLQTDGINAIDWSKDGRLIAAVSNDKKLRLWSGNSNELLATYSLSGWPNALSFAPGGSQLAYSAGREIIISPIKAEQ
jgi:WD40 repeat protein